MFRGGNKAKHSAETDAAEDEPQSPKVTCAGQIKVSRPKKPRPAAKHGGDGKSWVTVVEEIERLHEQRKKVSWLEAIGIRRDALPFLGGALRSLRLKARCFGSLHGAVDSSTDDDDDDDDDGAEDQEADGCGGGSVFSKWLMVLEENQEPQEQDLIQRQESDTKERDECSKTPSMPPPNALLLMRCRSAPAKGLPRLGAGEPPAGDGEQEKSSADAVTGDGTEGEQDKLVFMSTAPDFLKLSIDIAKETWVVGGMDPLARSRSWKR